MAIEKPMEDSHLLSVNNVQQGAVHATFTWSYSPKTDEGERHKVSLLAHVVGGTKHTCIDVAMEEVYNQVKSVFLSVWQRVILLIGIDCIDTAV